MPFRFHHQEGIGTMITTTRSIRAILVAATALAIAAPAASAKPFVVGPAGPSVASSGGYQGTYRPVVTNVQAAPDVVDRVGTVDQATGIHPLPVATRVTISSNAFDWTAAAVGAGSVLSLGLIGAGALGLRGRRRMALGV
jgi:hypothetical protein